MLGTWFMLRPVPPFIWTHDTESTTLCRFRLSNRWKFISVVGNEETKFLPYRSAVFLHDCEVFLTLLQLSRDSFKDAVSVSAGSLVGRVRWLRATRFGVRSRVGSMGYFFFSETFGLHFASNGVGTGLFFRRYDGRVLKLATYLHEWVDLYLTPIRLRVVDRDSFYLGQCFRVCNMK